MPAEIDKSPIEHVQARERAPTLGCERLLRRAMAAEAALITSAADRSQLARYLDRVQAALVTIDEALAESGRRKGEVQAEVANLRTALAGVDEKRRKTKKRHSLVGKLRQRAKRLLRLGGRTERQSRAEPVRAMSPPPPALDTSTAKAVTVQESLQRRFEAFIPLRTYPELRDGSRVTVITDSVSPGLLYGGVGTAILLATLLANRLGADLRLITRHHDADPGQVGAILSTFGVDLKGTFSSLFSPTREGADVPVFPGDLFLTTSWWTTSATMAAVNPLQIIYLLQEDERMFYPRGDERQLCASVLASDRIRFIINSKLLFRHFAEGDEPLPNIARHGCWFEPAFPEIHYRYDNSRRSRKDGKRNFLFYARPTALRNLYFLGLQTVVAAIEAGTLPPQEWNFIFVGRDLESVILPRGVTPRFLESLPWKDYAALVRQMDLGLSLIDTPHPSYPPLDMAASGAVVVTNICGVKTSLAHYSENIICADSTVPGLLNGLRQAVAIVSDDELRNANYERNRIERDWLTTLEGVLQFCDRSKR